jgi:hypothetical protein
MSMMWRRLKALWVLGWAFLLKILQRPLARRTGGDEWLARLRQEGLAATPADAWKHLSPASRCIGCGLCDAVVPEMSPSAWIAGAPRVPGDSPMVREEAQALHVHAGSIARVCPTRVGVDDIVALVEGNARSLEHP